jgi:O-antigen ligase
VVPLLYFANPWETRGVKPLLVEMMALALLGLGLVQVRVTPERRAVWAFLRTGPNLPVLLLVLYGGVSWVRSPLPGMSAVEWWRLASGAALYIVVAHALSRREQLQSVLDVLIGVAILASVLGFLSIGRVEATRITGTFGNSQLLAGFLLLLLPLLVTVWFSDVGPGRKIAAQVGALLTGCALIQAQTRTSWLSAAAALAVLGSLALSQAAQQSRVQRLGAQAVMPLAIVLAVLALFLLNTAALPTLQVRAATLTDPVNDGGVQWRLRLWRTAGSLIRERPLWGWGIGTFPHYAALWQHDGVPSCLASAIGPTLSRQAHNEYLQVSAELGLVGLGLYLWILGAFFACGMGTLRGRPRGVRRLILMGCLAALAGQMIDALSNPAWRFADVSFLFWLMLGLGTAVARPPRRPPEGRVLGARRTGCPVPGARCSALHVGPLPGRSRAPGTGHRAPRPPSTERPALRRFGWQASVLAITGLTMSAAWTAPRASHCPTPRHDEQGLVTVRVLRQSKARGSKAVFRPVPNTGKPTDLAPGECVQYVVLFNGRDVSHCYDVAVDASAGTEREVLRSDRTPGAGGHIFCVSADACGGSRRVGSGAQPRQSRMLIRPSGMRQVIDIKPVVKVLCGQR